MDWIAPGFLEWIPIPLPRFVDWIPGLDSSPGLERIPRLDWSGFLSWIGVESWIGCLVLEWFPGWDAIRFLDWIPRDMVRERTYRMWKRKFNALPTLKHLRFTSEFQWIVARRRVGSELFLPLQELRFLILYRIASLVEQIFYAG